MSKAIPISTEKAKKNYTSSFKLIFKEKRAKEATSYNLEVTNEGMEYLNQLNSNKIGIISVIGPEKSEKSYLANLILGDKAAFDSSKQTSDIYMWGQPIAQGENTDLLVLDTEGLNKAINSKTNYDKEIFILSCLTSSIMIYNTNDTIQECINKFTALAKESLSCIKKIEGKDLTSTDMPLIYFILHNNNIDSNTANQQFRNLVKDNPIFSIFFQNYKICVLKKAGDINKEIKSKSNLSKKLEEIGSLDDQDYRQKAKLIKDQIMNDLEPKKINNCNIDGKCLFGLIQSFVDSLNKNENIILFNQFNNVLVLCLSDVVDQINFNFTSEKLKEKMSSNISFEETYLDIIKTTFIDCIIEQCDKFNSTPIVKISPSTNVVENIKLIFRKCLTILCENVQTTVDKKTQIVNDILKLEFNHKIKNFNIEQLLLGFNNFITEKILFPLYGKNELKLQNNDKIFNVLKTKICGNLEKFAPIIQNIVNKLIAENKKLKEEFEEFKKNHKKEIEKKEEEVMSRKLNLDKKEEDMKQNDLIIRETIKREQLKYNDLERRYNKEINEKNVQIQELLKKLNTSIEINNTNGANASDDINNKKLQELKIDYNNITNVFVNYKILVNKLISDKDFFFENILIDKSIGNLKKKYPKIFDLLNEKEAMEECVKVFKKEKERLNTEIKRKETECGDYEIKIKELKEQLEKANQIIEDKSRLYIIKLNNVKSLNEVLDVSKREKKEMELKFKESLKKKDDDFYTIKNKFQKEINGLQVIIHCLFKKDKTTFLKTLETLTTESKNNLISWAKIYKYKW